MARGDEATLPASTGLLLTKPQQTKRFREPWPIWATRRWFALNNSYPSVFD
jgi:hypothetical protein